MLNNIEMQGTVLAGLKCAISIANIGKEALQNCVKTRLISIESKPKKTVLSCLLYLNHENQSDKSKNSLGAKKFCVQKIVC